MEVKKASSYFYLVSRVYPSECDVVFGLSSSAWSRMPSKAKTSKPVVFRCQPQCHDDSPKSKLNNHDRLNTHDSKFHAMVLPGHARLHVYVYIYMNIGSMDMVCISSHLVWHLFSPRARRTCCQELSGLVFFFSGGPWLDAFSSHDYLEDGKQNRHMWRQLQVGLVTSTFAR